MTDIELAATGPLKQTLPSVTKALIKAKPEEGL